MIQRRGYQISLVKMKTAYKLSMCYLGRKGQNRTLAYDKCPFKDTG